MGVLDVSPIFQIAGVGILTSILTGVLRSSGKEEQVQTMTIVASLIVLFLVLGMISDLFDTLRNFISVTARY
jgi:stage III sporulation protein AC